MKVRTYDPADCCSTGYDVTVTASRGMQVESHSRWQGSTSDARWRVRPSSAVEAAYDARDPDRLRAAVIDQLLDTDWRDDYTTRQTRRGYVVR